MSSLPAARLPVWRWTRRCVGASVAAGGLCVLALAAARQFTLLDARIAGALLGGAVAAAATAAGTLPVLLSQRISQRCSDALPGFGAGVMLAATSFSLIVPALAAAHELGAASGLVEPAASVLGAVAVTIAGSHEVIPGSHEKGHATSATAALVVGFVLMMVLDNALA